MSARHKSGRWSKRSKRLTQRAEMYKADAVRWLSWHLGGGSRFFEKYAPDLLQAHRWCFIVGCNNSGTSLLQGVLERSGQITTLAHEGQRYTRALLRATRRHHERVWSEYLDDLRMTEETRSDAVPRILHDLMREFEAPIKNIVVEKTTANSVRMRWLQEVFPNSYFIGLVRNGYAVSEGILRKGGKSVERAARHWNLVNEIMIDDARHLHHFLEVRYEDLSENHMQTARAIATFLGLDPESLTGALNTEFEFETVQGEGRMSIQNLDAECIDRLSASDLDTIARLAGPMLKKFGYERPGDART